MIVYNEFNDDENFIEVDKSKYDDLLERIISRKQLPKFETFEFPQGNSVVGDLRIESTNGYELAPHFKNQYIQHITNWHLGDNTDMRYCTILFKEMWDANDANVAKFMISKKTETQVMHYERCMEKLK